MTEATPTAAPPRRGLSDHAQVGVSLAAVGGVLALWGLFWPVPTEVQGTGVLIYPDNAGILNARTGGQVRELLVAVRARPPRPGADAAPSAGARAPAAAAAGQPAPAAARQPAARSTR
ncbi:MAG: hypothetical protein ACKO22_08780 [Cyanobium sp.]